MNFSWLLVLCAYVVGMAPSAGIVGNLVGHDPTREGSRNPGASNMYRIAGRNAGAIVLLADVAKGALPAALGLAVGGRELGIACGIAAVVGHIFPAIRGFRGGKGVATFGGMTLVCWWWVGLVGLVVWLGALRVSRKASIGALIAIPLTVALVAVSVAVSDRSSWEIVAAGAIGTLIVIRHHGNISRLLRSEEVSVTR